MFIIGKPKLVLMPDFSPVDNANSKVIL